MIITDKFVYLHFPKTGGTFVEIVMNRLHAGRGGTYYNTLREEDRAHFGSINQHEEYLNLPEEHRDRPILYTVRNPFDWYVSKYEFAFWRLVPGVLFDDDRMADRFPGYPDLSFPDFMQALNEPSLGVLLPDRRGIWGPELFADADVGFYTYTFIISLFKRPLEVLGQPGLGRRVDADWGEMPRTHFVTTCNLNRGLHDFLSGMGYEPGELEFILHHERINQTSTRIASGGTWAEYYTPAMLEEVRRRDRLFFAMFSRFERPSTTPSPTRRWGLTHRVAAAVPSTLRRLFATGTSGR